MSSARKPFMFAKDPELALRQAAQGGKLEVIKSLLEEHPWLNINAQGQDSGLSALHRACSENHVVVATHLVMRGADIHLRNQEGQSPMDICQNKNLHNLSEQLRLLHAIYLEYQIFQTEVLSVFKRKGCHENSEKFHAEFYRFQKSTQPDITKLRTFSLNAQICRQHTWALQQGEGCLSLMDSLNAETDAYFNVFAAYFYLSRVLTRDFPNLNIGVYSYTTDFKNKSYFLFIARDRQNVIRSHENLTNEANALVINVDDGQLMMLSDVAIFRPGVAGIHDVKVSSHVPEIAKLSEESQQRYRCKWDEYNERAYHLLTRHLTATCELNPTI